MRRLATEPDRINWFQVITDLTRAGAPVPAISSAINIPKGTILGWKYGAEPKFTDGEKLVALWAGLLGKPVTEVPRVREIWK